MRKFSFNGRCNTRRTALRCFQFEIRKIIREFQEVHGFVLRLRTTGRTGCDGATNDYAIILCLWWLKKKQCDTSFGIFLAFFLVRSASGGNQQFYDTKVREWLANKVRESRQGLGKAPAAGDVADRLLCIQGGVAGGGSAEY